MASYNWAPYQPASYCYGEPQRGTVYLSVFLTEQFPGSYCGNIYSCRDIVGGSSLSHHAEGRADDQMTVRSKPPSGISQAQRMLQMLGPHGKALGIDHIILNLTPWESGRGTPMIYNAAAPMRRVYNGEHPHKDHNHIGQTRVGAATMTLSKIRTIVGTEVPAPTPPPSKPGEIVLPLLYNPKVRSEDVALLQDMINEAYYPAGKPGLTIDGHYGNGTAAAVKKWLVPQTGDTNTEVLAGRKVNERMWKELWRDWIHKI